MNEPKGVAAHGSQIWGKGGRGSEDLVKFFFVMSKKKSFVKLISTYSSLSAYP